MLHMKYQFSNRALIKLVLYPYLPSILFLDKFHFTQGEKGNLFFNFYYKFILVINAFVICFIE